ncbi:hypothetical protein L2E82_15923 [Cichorium intybus]|uniref:Uncharacterized protein n=1 Tax=Cichorium intybus TaxID=13427 RepID=A0ACB9F444_CICIN|nr:hypothetical protein L2E82_15923 [Cichorium intybus]
MDHTVEDSTGIPDDLCCKRSDGKQWRCHAMSMPDKTVCERHYIQAKKRAANSAMRASLKKAKRKYVGESDSYTKFQHQGINTRKNYQRNILVIYLKHLPLRTHLFTFLQIQMMICKEIWQSLKKHHGHTEDHLLLQIHKRADMRRCMICHSESSEDTGGKFVISAGVMTQGGFYGILNVIGEDTVMNVSLHGILTFQLKKFIECVLHVEVAVTAKCFISSCRCFKATISDGKFDLGFNAGLFDYLIATDDSDSKEKEQTDENKQIEKKKTKKFKKRKADSEFGVVKGIDFKKIHTTLFYKLSGNYNPLHAYPNTAEVAG